MEVADPHRGVLDRPRPDAARVLAVVVHGRAPRALVAVGEVRAEGGQRLVARPDVVVDDVEVDSQALGMSSVHEAREGLRAAVGRVHGVRVEAVVSPAALAREGRDRHHLDRGDAELAEPGEPRDRGSERAPA